MTTRVVKVLTKEYNVDFEKQTGTVVWFSARKGFGFIKSDDPMDDKDIFVHWTGIEMEGYKQLKTDDKVEFVLKDSDKGIVAVEVMVTEAAPEPTQPESN